MIRFSSRKKDKQFCGVLSNIFPWKGSSGHSECSFNRNSYKNWEEKPKKNRKSFAEYPKMIRFSSRKKDKQFCGVLSNIFPWKGSSGHSECSFNRNSYKNWEEKPKKNRIMFLFSKTNNKFPQIFPVDTQNSVLKSFSHFYGKEVEIFGSKSGTDKKFNFTKNLSVET